jgi:hypothetical protein
MKSPLSETHPDLAAQWHPTKNGELTPDKVLAGSGKKVWWRCPNGPDHEWQIKVQSRTRERSGCPCCDGVKVSITNSLASLFPKIASQWHPTKNGVLTPDNIVAGSTQKVWWLCKNGPDHEWQATVGSRTSRTKPTSCPYCAGRAVSVTNSLGSLFPDVAAEWHPTRNGNLTPDQVVAGSQGKVWWLCPQSPDHEWQATLGDRTKRSRGCPFCAGQRVSVTNSLASLYPSIADEWHPSKNGGLTPDMVVAGSNKKFWWRCHKAPDH